jgi:hypothetical protein
VSIKLKVQGALPTPKTNSIPKWAPPNNKQKLAYIEATDAALFEAAGAPPPHGERPPSTGEERIEVYTDGSCPDKRAVSPTNPAGWGYNYKLNSEITGPDKPMAQSALPQTTQLLQLEQKSDLTTQLEFKLSLNC